MPDMFLFQKQHNACVVSGRNSVPTQSLCELVDSCVSHCKENEQSLRGPSEPDGRHHRSPMSGDTDWCGGRVLLLRKEVIQPHLPVRLPCYDFVPIASPTFDHSPPYGLGHGLRVLPTFVT